MKKLQVPENISLRWEAWRGFGRPELIKTLIITFGGTTAALTYTAATDQDAGMIIVTMAAILMFAFCVGLFSKLEHNQSIYDFFLRQAAFRREQQIFAYVKKEGGYLLVTEAAEGGGQAVNGAGIR